MDIYRFIDSRDMREHLQKLNYSFTTPEVAFLVYWCKAATLEGRIAAWREIIDTMPNCAMAERLNLEAIPDFHQFLRDHIDLQERDLRRLRIAGQQRMIRPMEIRPPGLRFEHHQQRQRRMPRCQHLMQRQGAVLPAAVGHDKGFSAFHHFSAFLARTGLFFSIADAR